MDCSAGRSALCSKAEKLPFKLLASFEHDNIVDTESLLWGRCGLVDFKGGPETGPSRPL